MENSIYETKVVDVILNAYEVATDERTPYQKKMEIKYNLKNMLLSCVDQGIESPISINKISRIAISEELETLDMKIEAALENLKFLSYKYGEDSRKIANDFLNCLLEIAVATTEESELNLPNVLSIQETMDILNTIPVFKDTENELDYPAINTLLDILTTIDDLLDDVRKWNISEELKYLTLEETYNLIKAFQYMDNNRGELVRIKLT